MDHQIKLGTSYVLFDMIIGAQQLDMIWLLFQVIVIVIYVFSQLK